MRPRGLLKGTCLKLLKPLGPFSRVLIATPTQAPLKDRQEEAQFWLPPTVVAVQPMILKIASVGELATASVDRTQGWGLAVACCSPGLSLNEELLKLPLKRCWGLGFLLNGQALVALVEVAPCWVLNVACPGPCSETLKARLGMTTSLCLWTGGHSQMQLASLNGADPTELKKLPL